MTNKNKTTKNNPRRCLTGEGSGRTIDLAPHLATFQLCDSEQVTPPPRTSVSSSVKLGGWMNEFQGPVQHPSLVGKLPEQGEQWDYPGSPSKWAPSEFFEYWVRRTNINIWAHWFTFHRGILWILFLSLRTRLTIWLNVSDILQGFREFTCKN